MKLALPSIAALAVGACLLLTGAAGGCNAQGTNPGGPEPTTDPVRIAYQTTGTGTYGPIKLDDDDDTETRDGVNGTYTRQVVLVGDSRAHVSVSGPGLVGCQIIRMSDSAVLDSDSGQQYAACRVSSDTMRG
jgi:hypothetical protein